MPLPAILLAIPAFAAGAAGGYYGKRAEVEAKGKQTTAKAIIDALTKASASGETDVFSDPGLPKMLRQYGIQPDFLSLQSQIAQGVKQRRAEAMKFLGIGGIGGQGAAEVAPPEAAPSAISEALPALAPDLRLPGYTPPNLAPSEYERTRGAPVRREYAFVPGEERVEGRPEISLEEPTPPSPLRAAPKVGVPPEPLAAAKAPAPSGVRAAGAALPPNVSVNVDPETGDLKFTVRGMTTDEHQQTMARYLLQQNTPFREVVTTMNASGLAMPVKLHEQLGRSESLKVYRRARQEIIAEGVKGPEADRRASEIALNETGYFNPNLPAPFADKAQFAQEALRIVQEQIDANPNVSPATIVANARQSNLPLTADDEVRILSAEYGKTKTTLLNAGVPEEIAIPLASARVAGDPRVVPPQDLAFVREAAAPPAVKPETAEQLFAAGKTTREAFRERGAGAAAVEAGRAAEVTQAGALATARKEAEEAVEIRPPTDLQKSLEDTEGSFKTLQRVVNRYDAAYVGLGEKTIGAVIELFGGKPKEEAKFRTEVTGMTNQIIRLIAGLTQTTQEAARASLELPQLNLPPHVFEARVEVMFDRLRDAYETALARGRDLGYRLPSFRFPETFTIGGKAAAPPPGGRAKWGDIAPGR